jgi:RpiR family transcriptional regulator, carbohydrate utilization regulator
MNERLSFLSERYDNLRRSERKVADSVLANAEQIIHYSVSQLAEEAKVSDPTVIRFCRSLGFKGFQDFKIRLAQSVVPTVRTIHESVDQNAEPPDLVQRVFEANIDAIRSSLKTLDFLTVGAVVDALARANRIIFHGLGGSAAVAMDAYHKFFRIGIPCVWLDDVHMALMAASMMKPGEVFVVISHSGASRDVVETAEVAAATGATTVAIVSYSKTPLAKVVNHTLRVGSAEIDFRFEPMASRIAQLSVIDVLSVGVSLKRSDEVIANLSKSRRALARKKF